MGFWMIVILANLIVGVLVGLTGVAGFLLPIVYTGPLGMGVPEGLALSFAAFIVSGALGAMNYKRAGNLDIPFGIRLSIGSLVGAVLGVKLNLVIPEGQVKILLYMVVLLSGVSILLRKDKVQTEGGGKTGYQITEHLPATLALGFVTGVICSLSGAGGPVLVMPLLVVLGVNVGIALFNSVFIGIPACIGYMTQCSALDLLPVLAAALLAHSIGVVFGSKNAVRINQIVLKKGIAVFSILIAVWKLAV
jgi:uncharacterized membrane protein YfcA